MADDTPPPRWSIAPCFIVHDVVATADFYRDRLGFHYERFWGDPPCFCMVKRSGIIIMLSQPGTRGLKRPNSAAESNGAAQDAYIWIEDADRLYAEFRSKGVKIVRELGNEPYGCRDFDIEDCNGYRLAFGQPIE